MSDRQIFRAPATAWPTLALAVGVVSLQALALVGAARGTVPLSLAGVLGFVAAFAAFTPLHDASHRSVSRRRGLNDWVGRVCGVVLLAPFIAFRYVHLEHHKHTNDAHRDPDMWAGRGPWWMLPLRWLTQDLHYYWAIASRWRQRPVAERREIVVNVVLVALVLGGLTAQGYGLAVLVAWVIPTRLAIAALALSFDYLPHVPHRVPAAQDRYAATRIIIAPGLTALFLYQNYHLIHHLYPGVPFYRYRRIYRAQAETLAARGALVTRVAPRLLGQRPLSPATR
ncbi:MAG: fatty acid desaturase [Myxococcota bacterium]